MYSYFVSPNFTVLTLTRVELNSFTNIRNDQ